MGTDLRMGVLSYCKGEVMRQLWEQRGWVYTIYLLLHTTCPFVNWLYILKSCTVLGRIIYVEYLYRIIHCVLVYYDSLDSYIKYLYTYFYIVSLMTSYITLLYSGKWLS